MAITYPLTLPLVPIAYSLEKRSVNLMTESPFTLQQHVMQGMGESFNLALTFAPVADPSSARLMSAFQTSLRGVYGTFEFGLHQRDLGYIDPSGTGTISLTSINNDLRNNITVSLSSANIKLSVGAFIQIGTQLLQVLDITEDSSTSLILDVFPMLRTAVAAATSVNFKTPKGVFRLKSSTSMVSFNTDHTYSFSIDAVEAITDEEPPITPSV